MAELTFYPDVDPESTSVDGRAYCYDSNGLTWTQVLASSGTHSHDVGVSIRLAIISHTDSDKWTVLERVIILFDTSAIPDGATITSAILYLYGAVGKDNGLGLSPTYNIYASAPASNTALVPGDYDSLGTTPFCDTPITYANWNEHATDDSLAENTFTLNAAGLAAISKTGITKLGVREVVYDVGGVVPAWTSDLGTDILMGSAESSDALWRPKLVVAFTTTAPQVTTDAASSVDDDSATLNGTLDDEGAGACTCSFDYGETTAYGTEVVASGTYNTGESFSKAVTGLLPGITYHFRAKANDGSLTGYGSDRTFTTTGTLFPTEAITRITNIIHRFDRRAGIFNMEINLGEVTTDFIEPSIIERQRITESTRKTVFDMLVELGLIER